MRGLGEMDIFILTRTLAVGLLLVDRITPCSAAGHEESKAGRILASRVDVEQGYAGNSLR